MKRKLLAAGRVFGLIVLGIAAFMGGVWLLSGPARVQADRVLAVVKANDPKALAPLMTAEVSKVASAEKVMHMARTWRLHEAEKLHWNSWSVATSGVDLKGYFKHADGTQQSLHMIFVQRDGILKLNLLASTNPALITDPMALSVPDSDELAALIARTTHLIGEGIRERGFTRLYGSMSLEGRATMAPEDLATIFAGFLNARIDIPALTKSEPLLDSPPGITPHGKLIVEGHYPTQILRLRFRYVFSNESGAWLLTTFDLGLKGKEPNSTFQVPTLE